MKKNAFSLIELLISVSIIGVLTLAVLVVIEPAKIRAKTRDAQRRSDLQTIKSALELYITDNKTYPTSGDGSTCGSSHVWEKISGLSGSNRSCLHQALTTVTNGSSYLEVIPYDPSKKDDSSYPSDPCIPALATDPYRYNYISSSDGARYILTAIMEDLGSNAGSKCNATDLPNWTGNSWSFGQMKCSSLDATFVDNYCYGVQNP